MSNAPMSFIFFFFIPFPTLSVLVLLAPLSIVLSMNLSFITPPSETGSTMSSSVHDLVLFSTWDCLSETHTLDKVQYFDMVFPDLPSLEDAFSTAAISFAPDLLDVLQSDTAPTSSFFKSLPAKPDNKTWAVYVLVLEKPDHETGIYIDSGTNTKGGVLYRWNEYDKNKRLPSNVEAALNEHYTIAHKDMLCWALRPTPASTPVCRLLFYALEATFAYLFWAYADSGFRGSNTAMSCHWDRDTLEYNGLCSHVALVD